MKDNILMYMTISDYNEDFEMTALYDSSTKKYYMPALQFLVDSPFGNIYWDNDDFIFDTFYPVLQRWKERSLTKKDKKKFSDELNAPEEFLLRIIDVIEQGIELGWNKLK